LKPNIVFLFPDQWRGDWIGKSTREKSLRTPTLERLAEEGVSFTKAFTPSPLCAPARACIATGKSYPAYGVFNNGQDLHSHATTVYQKLHNKGYHVMGCGKFDLHKTSYTWGKDGKHLLKEWGFDDGIDNEGKQDGILSYKKGQVGPYLHFLEKRNKAQEHIADFEKRKGSGTFPTTLQDDEYCDNWICDNALQLLDRAPQDKPWFIQVNFAGPHIPFDVTQEMYRWHKNTTFPPPFGVNENDVEINKRRQNYADMIENIDRNMQKILDHPRIHNDKENTIIIFASDHGDMLGDFGYWGKAKPYNGSSNVPLIFSGCTIPHGKCINTPVTILDLPSTFLDVAGEKEACADSISLLPTIKDEKPNRKFICSSLYVENNPAAMWRMIIKERYKYIIWDNAKEALYSLDDYQEKDNLIQDKPEIARQLHDEIEKNIPISSRPLKK